MTEPNPTHADPGDASLSQLYQQVILDHYRSPRNAHDHDEQPALR
jgi:hypothetical protein